MQVELGGAEEPPEEGDQTRVAAQGVVLRTRHEVVEQDAAAYYLTPGVPHTYGPGPGTWTEYWVLFEGPAAGRYEDLGHLSAGAAVVRPAEPERATAALELLLDIAGRPESTAHHVAAGAALHSLICAVGAAGPPPTGGRRGTGREIGRRALAILTRDAAGPVSIEAVARELSVSRDTLVTEVRRPTGSTPSDYLMRLRLSRAKTLLAGSDRPVARVAREVGYGRSGPARPGPASDGGRRLPSRIHRAALRLGA